MPKKLPAKKLNYFIKDEKKAIKEYNKAGLPKLAKDEKKHLKFLEAQKRKQK